ncbi:type II secretion system protein N [Psychromonas sp.]|nr:type II secretion system protein N [Psychromonas sp.]
MKVKIALLVVFVYFGTLVINLPAAVVVQWMPASAAKVSDVSGSIWQGKAKQVEINNKVTLRDVKWDIQVMSLLSATLESDVSFNNGPQAMSGEAIVKYSISSGVSASNLMLDITSQELLTFLPMRLPVNISGDFSVAIKEFKQGAPYCEQLDGVVIWNNAYIYSQMGNIDLAAPSIDLRCDEGNLSAFVTQNSDQLTTTLDVRLNEGDKYELNGEIKGTDKLAPSIAKSLTWVGPVNDSGATTISFKGQL